MLELGQRQRVVLDAVVEGLPVAPEVGDERVVGVQDEAGRGRQAGDDRRPAVGDDLELAVAVELVAEQVAEQHRARLELGRDRSEPELVDLEQAHVAAARARRASAAATPPAMFAPARLWTSRVPVRPRIVAIIAAVVVLPLVAETTTLPCGSRAPSRAIACGSARISTLPGSDVPPRPARRSAVPVARAASSPACSLTARSPAARRAARARSSAGRRSGRRRRTR